MGAKVTYEGEIEPAQTGEFKFILYYAGYVKVYLNNEPVVPERWRTAWNPNSYKFAAHLEAGKRVPLKIEWQPDGGQSYCGLRALTPVNPEEQGKQSWWSEMTKQLDYYFMAGENMDDVISGYRSLTGKSPVMPKWAMGFWQSREKYNTQEEMLGALKGFRDRKIPLDNIVLDWNHWPENAWGSHEFDKARFPDPKAMVDSIHAMHARMMISVWPKFYVTTEHFKEFDENGWMYQQSVKDSLKDWVGPGYHYGFMMRMIPMHGNCSGNRCMSTIIRWVSMLGGWMPANRMYVTVPTWNIGKLCADLQRWVPLRNFQCVCTDECRSHL